MKSSSGKSFEVFDFKEEDELIESASGRFVEKFRKPKADNSAINKYRFLECFARGTNVQQIEISNVPCLDVDASDGDRKCNNSVSYALDTLIGDCVIEEGIPGFDAVWGSNSSSCKPHVHRSPDNLISGSLLHRVNSLATRALSPEVPSTGNKQLNWTLPESPSDVLYSYSILRNYVRSPDVEFKEPHFLLNLELPQNEPVDVSSDDDEGMNMSSPSTSDSDLAQREVSSEEQTSYHCFGGWQMDDIKREVVVFPDYIICGDRDCTESLLTFSCSCIKLEGSITYGNKGAFSFEWEISDVIAIESKWCGRAETAMVKLCVKPKDAMRAENVHGTSGIEEVKFAVCDPNWSETQEKITSLDVRYTVIWNVVLDCDLPVEDVIYPKGDPDAVSISKRDVELLQPETFINDTIIDFYIKYLKNKIQPEEKDRFHFFNSFFFRKLADLDKDPSSASQGRAAFQRVQKWTKKVNLFEKDFIFIPINFNLHWSLIVICHPGEVANFKDEEIDKSFKVPCILHMDSIKGSHKGLKNLVQSYLWEEWKERQKETSGDVFSKFLNLQFFPLELPQQENSFDCGLFLLHYVERFLEEAPANFSPFKITKFSKFLNMDWFPPAEASLKRSRIRKLIYELLEDHSQEIPPAALSNGRRSSEFPENNNEKEIAIEFLEGRSPAKTHHGDSSNSPDQGIEITLLATSPLRGVQSVRDTGLVLRELFEPRTTAGSFSYGQYRPFDQMASFHQLKIDILPIEEPLLQPLGRGSRLETCVVEDSPEASRMPDSNESVDPPSCQENTTASSILEADSADNMDLTGNDLQLDGDDLMSEADEQQASDTRGQCYPLKGHIHD
ncbi:hypothetical protein HHK36_030758 [Tetracentron sinense]|uniref:Ubiquitin-like protease family profile domain-containing protein n=1 Tax=Tetracentron sinense TaxID=13715 RepID=A0A835D0Z4_TETSI|nr:hypothetical protein HHK36_030758 [Tetracentron sinense]